MRFSRLVIGVLVVLVALWVIVSEQMAGASADAVVNAQVVVVRTPIAGTLRDADRGLGSAVSAGDALATVVDPMPDAVRLDDLVLQRELAEIRRSVQEARKTYLEQELERQTLRSTQYRDLSVQDLTARLAEARERLRHLVEAISPTDEITLSRAREEATSLQIMLTGAEKGVFIAGGFNDAPYSEQNADTLRRDLHLVTQEIDAATAEIAAVTRRIDQERIRVGRMGSAAITSPVGGVIWERMAVTGSHVERGDAVLRLADCDNVFVTLSVTQPVFNRLQLGGTATFRFDGSGEVMTGTVARLAGTSASSFYDSLAVAPGERHLERADVLLSLPELAEHPQLRCAIGRTGRAFFEVRPLDWLRAYFQ